MPGFRLIIAPPATTPSPQGTSHRVGHQIKIRLAKWHVQLMCLITPRRTALNRLPQPVPHVAPSMHRPHCGKRGKLRAPSNAYSLRCSTLSEIAFSQDDIASGRVRDRGQNMRPAPIGPPAPSTA